MNAFDVVSGSRQWSVDNADVRAWLRSLPSGVAQTCITSPPYFGLRAYLKSDDPSKIHEIGSEPTPEDFIETMVDVFREVRRVMRDDAVLWLNLGDGYNADGDLLNMPHRVAQALQADSWYWRQTVVWQKKSPMPESIQGVRWQRCRVKIAPSPINRMGDPSKTGIRSWAGSTEHYGESAAQWLTCPGCPKCAATDGWILRRGRWRNTTAHEYVFMLTKSARYFCDGEAVKEKAVGRWPGNKNIGKGPAPGSGFQQRVIGHLRRDVGAVDSRNPRSVLTLSTEPFKGSHFATFPSSLIKPFIEAATSAAGCCAACGACYAPMVESERVPTRPGKNCVPVGDSGANRDPNRHCQVSRVLGYRPTCACKNPSPPRPCIVLEPFAGSGTTLQVATHMGRRAIGCELNMDYLPLIEKRVAEVPRCLVTKKNKPKTRKPKPEVLPLFDI